MADQMEVEKTSPRKEQPEKRKDTSYAKSKKQQQDFEELVNKRLPELQELAATNPEGAVEGMLALEKQTRVGEDALATGRVLVAIISIWGDRKNYDRVREYVQLLSKRHGQLKQAVTRMVQHAMTYLDGMPEPEQLSTIAALLDVCEGKIHVELERARLTRRLAAIKEAKGQIAEAADTLQAVQVETFGSMDNREKFDFILEQMRLCLAKGDYVRTELLSKKIVSKALNDKELQDLRLRYYALMIRFYQHEVRYLDLTRCYLEVYNTPTVSADEQQWRKALAGVCIHVCLAPYDNEQSDIMNRMYIDKRLEQLPAVKAMLKYFLTIELMKWPQFEEKFQKTFQELCAAYPDMQGEFARTAWEDMFKRVVEHNVRVLAKYYGRITMPRLAFLLNMDVDAAERFVCDMVSSHAVYAKIDRPAGIVVFARPKDENELLNEWSYNVGKLLSLVEDTCHMINKERMVHAASKAQRA